MLLLAVHDWLPTGSGVSSVSQAHSAHFSSERHPSSFPRNTLPPAWPPADHVRMPRLDGEHRPSPCSGGGLMTMSVATDPEPSHIWKDTDGSIWSGST